MTPFEGATVWWHQSFRDDPAHMLIKLNKRDRSLYDLYRLNIQNGQLTLVAENPGDVINWVTDKAGTIIARYRRLEDGGWVMEVATGKNGAWKTLITGKADEDFLSQAHSPDGTFLWGLSNRGRDKTSFVRLDLKTGVEEVMFSHPQVDVAGAWVDDQTYEPLMVWSWPGYLEFHNFDKALGADMAVFCTDEPANVWIQSADKSKTILTVKVETERTDTSYYLVDRKTKTKTLLAAAPMAKHKKKLSRSEPIYFKTRDGLTVHGYLTIPKGTNGRNLPMVLRVHGGPWWRDHWGYHVIDQFLANRGYAVLSVNYRGSTGYGRAFIKASRRQFAHKMHDDLIDGVNWAIRQGIADPKKIAIFGRSYGGYATMVGLTFTPEVFAAGVNVVGVADLVRTAETFPAYWKQWIHRWLDYVGDPKKPEDRVDMAARSPINFIDRIQRPLLMAQGANDVRVVREHSDRIAAAMEKAGKDFDYIVFEDEGHAIRKWQNQLVFARKLEHFLAKHLGGRAGSGD